MLSQLGHAMRGPQVRLGVTQDTAFDHNNKSIPANNQLQATPDQTPDQMPNMRL